MPKFVYVVNGGTMAPTPAQQEAVMQQWGAWFGAIGSALLEEGNPFGESATVWANGITPGAPAGSYAIVVADSLDEATSMAKSCPVLGTGGTVQVYQALQI